mmetsp:Transcript_28066/g.80766  ORF Transcript_28066/g.80766 Transcript_28066/m.80766 type:complete len:363 (+) Transcript_28066:999-2087(+)
MRRRLSRNGGGGLEATAPSEAPHQRDRQTLRRQRQTEPLDHVVLDTRHYQTRARHADDVGYVARSTTPVRQRLRRRSHCQTRSVLTIEVVPSLEAQVNLAALQLLAQCIQLLERDDTPPLIDAAGPGDPTESPGLLLRDALAVEVDHPICRLKSRDRILGIRRPDAENVRILESVAHWDGGGQREMRWHVFVPLFQNPSDDPLCSVHFAVSVADLEDVTLHREPWRYRRRHCTLDCRWPPPQIVEDEEEGRPIHVAEFSQTLPRSHGAEIRVESACLLEHADVGEGCWVDRPEHLIEGDVLTKGRHRQVVYEVGDLVADPAGDVGTERDLNAFLAAGKRLEVVGVRQDLGPTGQVLVQSTLT